MKKAIKKSPLAHLGNEARWGFLTGARWERRGERRFVVPRSGAMALFVDQEARLAVEGHRHPEPQEEYA